jgi:hypothetical protein
LAAVRPVSARIKHVLAAKTWAEAPRDDATDATHDGA